MTKLKLLLCAGPAALGLAYASAAFADTPAPPAAPAPTPMANPAMAAPLVANPHPATFDAGPLGSITVDGVLSGGGIFESNPGFNGFGQKNSDADADVTNAQIILNGGKGNWSFYVQAGAYNTPSLGTPYYRTTDLT